MSARLCARARSTHHTHSLGKDTTKSGVRVEFVKENLSFSGEASPMAQLMLSVMGAFAEFERALIRIHASSDF